MDTPIVDFVKTYTQSSVVRLHMPGHKGHPFLGCEPWDITEIQGADALYEADGIIAQSEANAASLFGSARTLYSTEGSSQCIRAMIHLAVNRKKNDGHRPWILAGRNAHKALLYALALADADAQWLWPEEMNSLCSCAITPHQVETALRDAVYPPSAVYVTSPDYLGGQLPLREIAQVCHQYGVPLLVDNAHGAYLRFLPQSQHPMDLGADLCCDSAHKTLPVLTGGAYLHISPHAPAEFTRNAKAAMALFGSTSPSYLTLSSLDLCNDYLARAFPERLRQITAETLLARAALRQQGWQIEETESLKLTIRTPAGLSGCELAQMLRQRGIECEFADRDYVVLMISTETTAAELSSTTSAFGKNIWGEVGPTLLRPAKCHRAMTVREALFAPQEQVSLTSAKGRICAAPAVGCPPAIPIAVSGEVLEEDALRLFAYYGIRDVAVVCR